MELLLVYANLSVPGASALLESAHDRVAERYERSTVVPPLKEPYAATLAKMG